MKKLSIIAFAAAVLFAGCQQERGMEQVTTDPTMTAIKASRELSTRSLLQAEGGEEAPSYSILWDAPDSILVSYGGTTMASFKSKNEEPAAEATFVGKLPEGSGTLYGIYPASSDHSVDADGVFSIAFKDVQTAVAGSYDPEAFSAVAASDSKELSFLNVCGLLALQVGYDDVTKISLSGDVSYPVTTRFAAIEPIPGGILTGEIGSDGLELTSYSEDLYEIVLNAPEGGFFSQKETYYMAVPPCTLQYGATFTLSRESGEPVEVVIEGSLTMDRSKVHKVKTLYVEPYIPIESVEVNPKEVTVEEGKEVALTITVTPSNASNQDMVLESVDDNIATVSDTGVVTGVAKGETSIKIMVGDYDTITVPVTVKEPYIPVTSITLKPSPYNIKLDEYGDYMISATVEPANASNPILSAESSDKTIVTVGFDYDDVTINVYPHAVGEATITVSCADGITAECKVTVEPIPVEDILIVPPSDIVFGSGPQKLDYDVFPTNATNPKVSWESSDVKIVSVDKNGNITPVGVGQCTITATAQDGSNVKETCPVRVIPTEITKCDYTDYLYFTSDEAQRIYVTISPDDGSHTIKFTSADESVAVVDNEGYVTPKGDGITYIKISDAYYGGPLGACSVEVQLPNWVTAVSIDKSVTETWVHGKLSLVCYLEPYDGDYESIVWSSGDESVARVSPDGEFTAINPGSVNITVTVYVHNSTTVSDTFRFTVLDE